MLGIKKPGDAGRGQRVREVRAWARELHALPDEVTVMVTELTCSEPGCPPVETVVAVLQGKGQNRQAKVSVAITEVTREHVAAMKFELVAEATPSHDAPSGGVTR